MEAYYQHEATAPHSGSVLVWVDDAATALPLLRTAQRKARELGVSWEILHVDKPRQRRSNTGHEAAQILATLSLAEQMGGKTIHTIAPSGRSAITRLLAERAQAGQPIQLLVLAQRKSRWFGISDADALTRRAPNGLRVLSVESPGDMLPSKTHWLTLFKFSLLEIINCITAVAIATAAIQILEHFAPSAASTDDYSKTVFYMISCAFAAGRYGLFAGIFTAIISFIVFNLLYISPNWNLALGGVADMVNFAVYLSAALVISFFASQSFNQREKYAARAQRTHALFQLHRVAMDYRTRSEAVAALHKEISTILGSTVVFFLPTAINPNQLEATYPSDVILSSEEQEALNYCWKESKATGLGAPIANHLNWRFLPLLTSQGEIGVLAIHIEDRQHFDIPSARLLNAVADQAALIIERFELGQLMEESRLSEEREKLRAMLLSSVSHDLKTPLASVIGALSVYQTMGNKLSDEHRQVLITTALEEAQRLDSFITNILDMTRLESGTLDFRKEWVSPHELIRKTERRMRTRLRGHPLVIRPENMDDQIFIDPMSAEQMLQNLFDNAAKYTPAGTQITLRAYPKEAQFVIEVHDQGSGIPADKLNMIFDKYARLRMTDSQVAGTGLGLAICKSMMQAQGGSIEAANHPDGGAIFTMTFPQWRQPQMEDAA